MSDAILRRELVKLASAHPEHRGAVLPLVSVKVAAVARGYKTGSAALARYNLDVYGGDVDADRWAERFTAALNKTGSDDFCQISGLCRGNLGLARIEMPVLEGRFLTDFLKRLVQGNLDLDDIQPTKDWLMGAGGDKVSVRKTIEPAAKLKATQREINADKAEGMADKARAGTFDPGKEPVLMSADGYILDGHHRWAAQILRAAQDGIQATLAGFKVALPVDTLLEAANAYTDAMGIARKGF
jgi:hypothetical protein